MSVTNADQPCVHVIVAGESCPDPLSEALNTIASRAAKEDGLTTVLLLGRYRHSKPQHMAALARRHSGLHFSFLTVHRSKGLEADYVVVLDLCSGKYGFPSEIVDDLLLDLVLAAPEGYSNAEERRLFYVAVTRAKRAVYLVSDGGSPSTFVKELMKDRYDITVPGLQQKQDVACPKCVDGRLTSRRNAQDGGTFYGRSHWPYCGYMQSACPNCRTGFMTRTGGSYRCANCALSVERCPRCDGWLRMKKGKFGLS